MSWKSLLDLCVLSLSITTVSFVLSPDSEAANPDLNIHVDAGPGAQLSMSKTYLDTIAFYGCGNPLNVVQVEQLVSLDGTWSVSLPDDDFCNVTLTFKTDIVSEGTEGANAFLFVSPTRQINALITSGQTLAIDLFGSHTLQGIYGGNPQIIIERETP